MREIRRLTDQDWEAYTTVTLNAYPGIKTTRENVRQRASRMSSDPIISIYGLFENGRLLGVMRLYDFTMKLLSIKTLVGGVGGVAVDLLHKKKKVAFDMLQYFLHHYRQKGACLTALYPFRPDFYKQMGFGYGRKMNQYRVPTASLPQGPARANVSLLRSRDRAAFDACYQRHLESTNGLMENFPYLLDTLFNSQSLQIAAYWHDGEIRGYLVFRFEPGSGSSFLSNNIFVRSLVYETPEALSELLGFLRSQADQIETVIFNTQDEAFHLVLPDPRNDSGRMLPSVYHESNTQGIGIMYRVIDVPGLFDILNEHDFGGKTCRLKLSIADSFLPENAGSWVIAFDKGRARLVRERDHFDVALRLDVAEFSALVIGATDFKTLMKYGLAEISDPAYTNTIQRLFFVENKPLCMTSF